MGFGPAATGDSQLPVQGVTVLARFRKAMDEREEGFTLIELLVVMIIIGILAAIAIPVFLSQKNKAKTTSAKSDVSIIGKDVASYYVDGTSALVLVSVAGGWELHAGTSAGALVDSGKLSSGNSVATTTAVSTVTSDSAWCVAVQGGDTAASVYSYSADKGLKANGCTGGTTN
jgi:type IV pilus assembly protein PilA